MRTLWRGLVIIEYDRNDETGHFYDLHELAFDNPRHFKNILEKACERYSSLEIEIERKRKGARELALVSAIQREITESLIDSRKSRYSKNAPSKATIYDHEIERVKNDLFWANIKPDESVNTVFWQDTYDPLVSFLRRRGQATMAGLLNMTSQELKEAGFSADFMTKIISVLKTWAERKINPETAVIKEIKDIVDAEVNEDAAANVLSFFFGEEDDEQENDNGGE